MTTSMGTTSILADGTADGLNGIPHSDDEQEGTGSKAADLPQNKHSSRRKGDTQRHDAGTETPSIVPYLTDILAGVIMRTHKWTIMILILCTFPCQGRYTRGYKKQP